MEVYRVVIVHGFRDAVAALADGAAFGVANGTPVTLLSAPGAALYAGCGWWRALVAEARAAHPEVPCLDILDCADATGDALAALRIGSRHLVLWPEAPGRDAVVAIAELMGGFVLSAAPQATSVLTTSRISQGAMRGAGGSGDRGAANGDKLRTPG